MRERKALLVRLDVVEELPETGGWKCRPRDQRHGHVGDAPDRLKIIDGVIRQFAVERGSRCDADMHQEHRISVGLRSCDARRPDGSAGAPVGFDNDLLLERGTQRGSKIPRGTSVGPPATYG